MLKQREMEMQREKPMEIRMHRYLELDCGVVSRVNSCIWFLLLFPAQSRGLNLAYLRDVMAMERS